MTRSTRHQVIINADDFGLSSKENRAILAAFEQGVVSSATLMANMPAFAEACELAHQHELEQCLGLHFNLTYGSPLSTPITRHKTLCSGSGEFDFSIPRYAMILPATVRTAIRTELEAQWQRCLDHGIRPSHIDSHQHVHNILPIAGLVAEFAHQQQVPIRLARNLGHNIGPLKRLYKWLLNRRMTQLAGRTATYVCTPRDLLDGIRPGSPVEVVAHPLIMADGSIGDDYLPAGTSLATTLDIALPQHERIDYPALQSIYLQQTSQ